LFLFLAGPIQQYPSLEGGVNRKTAKYRPQAEKGENAAVCGKECSDRWCRAERKSAGREKEVGEGARDGKKIDTYPWCNWYVGKRRRTEHPSVPRSSP